VNVREEDSVQDIMGRVELLKRSKLDLRLLCFFPFEECVSINFGADLLDFRGVGL
jgi:hypothetical protein